MARELSTGSNPDTGRDPGRQQATRPLGAESLDDRVEATVARFISHLESDGLHTALGYLNSQTRFRYTGVYRFVPPFLCSIEIYDRENPALALREEMEMRTTYCSIVEETGAPFALDDGGTDARVAGHPARDRFAAYCGVPLRAPGGGQFGTLCHHDPRPRIGSANQIALLERVAPLVAAYSFARLS